MKTKKGKKEVDSEIREIAQEIIRGRRELCRAKKDAIKNGGWDDIIPLLVYEKNPDVLSYREQMEKAGITIDTLREIARHSQARIKRMPETESLEQSRKGEL